MVKCRVCSIDCRPIKGQGNICRACLREYHRKWRADNPDFERKRTERRRKDPGFVESERKRGREYWQKLRHQAIMAYGGYICACCGETEPTFLTLDHINNDGAEHRRSLGAINGNGKEGYGRTLKWLRDNDYPDGFQVLCMNCNFGKARNGGVCPHATLHKQTG